MNLYLPLVQDATHPPRANAVPLGWALYGVPHATQHEQLALGKPLLDWAAGACCLAYPSYYPTLHSTLWWTDPAQVDVLASTFPGHTWLLLNEPDMPPPQAFIRPDYALSLVRAWLAALNGARWAGCGVTITDPAHWTSTFSQTGWNTIGWRKWLDDWNRLRGPVPPVAHVHIYASTRQAWQDQYSLWREWNRVNWQVPTIISECGESPAVWAYLRDEFSDAGVEALLWFTNFTDDVLPGLPEA